MGKREIDTLLIIRRKKDNTFYCKQRINDIWYSCIVELEGRHENVISKGEWKLNNITLSEYYDYSGIYGEDDEGLIDGEFVIRLVNGEKIITSLLRATTMIEDLYFDREILLDCFGKIHQFESQVDKPVNAPLPILVKEKRFIYEGETFLRVEFVEVYKYHNEQDEYRHKVVEKDIPIMDYGDGHKARLEQKRIEQNKTTSADVQKYRKQKSDVARALKLKQMLERVKGI